MALTLKEVEHIAGLARLGLTEEEKEMFATQLSAILDHFESLTELDTSAVTPTTAAIPLENVMREDRVQPSLPPEDILANAPQSVDHLFRVRVILE